VLVSLKNGSWNSKILPVNFGFQFPQWVNGNGLNRSPQENLTFNNCTVILLYPYQWPDFLRHKNCCQEVHSGWWWACKPFLIKGWPTMTIQSAQKSEFWPFFKTCYCKEFRNWVPKLILIQKTSVTRLKSIRQFPLTHVFLRGFSLENWLGVSQGQDFLSLADLHLQVDFIVHGQLELDSIWILGNYNRTPWWSLTFKLQCYSKKLPE